MQTVQYDAADIVALFAQAVGLTYRTRLLPGGDEPLYRPASQPDGWHEIIFRHDYFQSALHEIAHWCVAGQARRQCVDFGYWYEPDGRNSAQQATFERVEARPQAVEWVLSAACGKAFYVSLDNLGSEDPLDEESLWRAVHGEVLRCLGGSLPPRAQILGATFAAHYGQPWPPAADYFLLPSGGENASV